MIEHVAIWTNRLEEMKEFYVRYFNGTANQKYVSPRADGVFFESYFLIFGGGSRLEIMQMSTIPEGPGQQTLGLSHIAFGLDSEDTVRALVQRFKSDGYAMAGEPRRTGDGYYEASVYDPGGNLVEITAIK